MLDSCGVQYIEHTDQCSTLRGPPRDTGYFSHTSTDIALVLETPPVDCILTQPVMDAERDREVLLPLVMAAEKDPAGPL